MYASNHTQLTSSTHTTIFICTAKFVLGVHGSDSSKQASMKFPDHSKEVVTNFVFLCVIRNK